MMNIKFVELGEDSEDTPDTVECEDPRGDVEYDVTIENDVTVYPHEPDRYAEGAVIDEWVVEDDGETSVVSLEYLEENSDFGQSHFETEIPIEYLAEDSVEEWRGEESISVDVYGDPSRQTISRIDFNKEMTYEAARLIGLLE